MAWKPGGRRRPDRVQNVDLYWAGRMAKASTPKDRAAVELDRLRVVLSRLPDREARQLWSALAGQLASFRQKITDGDVHRSNSRRDSRR